MQCVGAGKALAVALVAMCMAGSALHAHTGATGIVKMRMDAMSDIGKQMKLIAAMVKGERRFRRTSMKSAAEAIAGHARAIPKQFPKGSGKAPSEAAPAIWSDWSGFVALAKQMETRAQMLATAASGADRADAVLPELAEVGKTCKTCHESYRRPK